MSAVRSALYAMYSPSLLKHQSIPVPSLKMRNVASSFSSQSSSFVSTAAANISSTSASHIALPSCSGSERAGLSCARSRSNL